MRQYIASNQSLWDSWTRYHIDSQFYNVAEFKAGRDYVCHLALDGLGSVRGKSLLHLQCHFGLDTLALTRRGANATGVDFSEEAIKSARALANELNLPAHFVQSDVYDLPRNLVDRFDLVFSSHGAICWLPDLEEWARVISHFLRPNGTFYLLDIHPFALILDKHRDDGELRVGESYFRGPEPLRKEAHGSYAARDAPIQSVSFIWLHRLADVIGSLVRAGLRLTAFEEYPFMPWPYFPRMEQRLDGMWQMPSDRPNIPLTFSLQATKPD